MPRTPAARLSRALLAPVLLAALTVAATPAVADTETNTGEASAAADFVARDGQALLLGGQPFRMVGYNVWGANVTAPQPNTSYALNADSALDETFQAMDGSANTVRTWFFQQYVTTDGGYDWSAFDKTLAVARAHHVKIVATLADQWTFGGTDFRDFSFYAGGYADQVGARERVPYRQYVQDVVARYKDDPTIAMWELVNEPEDFTDATQTSCPSNAGEVMANFASDVAGVVKAADPNHLVSLGTVGTGACGTNESDYERVMRAPQLDVCSFHDYYGPGNPAAYEPYNGLNVRVQQCAALDKPILIGELGIGRYETSPQGRADAFDAKLQTQFAMQGVVGILAWQFDVRGPGHGDDYIIGPNDPVIAVLARYAG